MKNPFLALIFLTISALSLKGQVLQQANPYYIGHSLVNLQIPAMVNTFAQNGGKTSEYAYQIGIGANLWYQWDTILGNEQGIRWQVALPSGNYDALVMTEAVPLIGHLTWSNTYNFTDSFLLAARAGNPSCRTFIYETWHCNRTGTPTGCEWDNDDDLLWRPRLIADFPLWTGIMDTLKNRHADAPVWMIPAGQALGNLVDSIDAGKIPGITDYKTLFSDDIHLTSVGNYFVACVMYACIFRDNPVGMPAQTFDEWGGAFPNIPTAAQALKFQQTAWQTVTALSSRTGVQGVSNVSNSTAQKGKIMVFPNPISENEPLQIVLENDFLGTVKFEILSLDGRVLDIFFTEKTSRVLTLNHPVPSAASAFLVRVLDGKGSETRLVLKF